MQTITITAHTNEPSQIEAVKAFMKALKIKFEISKEQTYDPDFVEKIKRSETDFKNRETKSVAIQDLDKFIDEL